MLTACSGKTPHAASPSALPTTPGTAVAATPPPTAVEPTISYVATAEAPRIDIYDAPDQAEPAQTMRNPNPTYGTARVFLVQEVKGDWLKVSLPTRPNGSTGWIRKGDVSLAHHDY